MFLAFAEVLLLTTPCFETKIEINPGYVLEVRAIYQGNVVAIERPGQPNVISASLCGVGDWVIESRTASECIEWIGYRNVTGKPCVWSEWIETLTATVSDQSGPNTPRFVLRRDLVRTPDS
jgi:hypothetical protein